MDHPVQPGPPAQFIAEMTRAQRALYAFLVSLLRNPADADDVLQETNIVLWQKAGEFDPSRNFMPWAFRVAQFQAMAHLKRKKRSRLAFDDALLAQIADEAVAEAADMEPRRAALLECLKRLAPDQRQLVARRYEPGGSVNDMARERGTTPKALSEMLRRIRRALMLCIERRLAREARA